MADTVTIAGHKVNKWLAYGGGAALVVVAIVIYRKRQAAAAAAASSSSPSSSATDTTSQGIDPATGYPYGSPEDQAALQAMGSGYGGGYGGYGFGGGGYPGPGGGGSPGGGGFTTNSQWTQAAEQYMGSNGSDAIAAALGKYIAGLPITSDQAQIVEEAIAAEGNPPVNGPNGMPPSFKIIPGGGGGGNNAVNPVTGLKVSKPGTTGVDITWSPSRGAKSYQVTSTAGNVQMTGSTSARIHSINAPGHPGSATVTVLAEPAASGATPATLHVTTNK